MPAQSCDPLSSGRQGICNQQAHTCIMHCMTIGGGAGLTLCHGNRKLRADKKTAPALEPLTLWSINLGSPLEWALYFACLTPQIQLASPPDISGRCVVPVRRLKSHPTITNSVGVLKPEERRTGVRWCPSCGTHRNSRTNGGASRQVAPHALPPHPIRLINLFLRPSPGFEPVQACVGALGRPTKPLIHQCPLPARSQVE